MGAHVVRRNRVRTFKIGSVTKQQKSTMIISRPFFGEDGFKTAQQFKTMAEKTEQSNPEIVDTFDVIFIDDKEVRKLL